MANRSLRRASNTGGGTQGTGDGAGNVAANESGTVTDADSSTVGDDNQVAGERNGNERIRIVEVEPEQLGEFIASGGKGASGSEGSGEGSGARKARSDRGIKRGRRTQKEAPKNLEVVVSMLHSTLAVVLHTPELMLDESEVKQLSEAYSEFCMYHDIPILTPKRMSEVALIAVAIKLYGTRGMAIHERRKQERLQKRGNVTPINAQAQAAHAPVN